MSTIWHHANSNPDIEIRELKEGKFTIAGYAVIFNSLSEDLGGFKEIIKPGAFDRTLKEIENGREPDVSARVQHLGGLTTIGRISNGTLRLSVDKKGLRYEVDTPNTSAGRDIVTLVKGQYINKSSFAFSVAPGGEEWDDTVYPYVRTLTDLDLYDVAPVDGPAYEATTVNMRATPEMLDEVVKKSKEYKRESMTEPTIKNAIQILQDEISQELKKYRV